MPQTSSETDASALSLIFSAESLHFSSASELANAAELEEEAANVDPMRNTARSTAVDRVTKDTFSYYIRYYIIYNDFYHIIEVWF